MKALSWDEPRHWTLEWRDVSAQVVGPLDNRSCAAAAVLPGESAGDDRVVFSGGLNDAKYFSLGESQVLRARDLSLEPLERAAPAGAPDPSRLLACHSLHSVPLPLPGGGAERVLVQIGSLPHAPELYSERLERPPESLPALRWDAASAAWQPVSAREGPCHRFGHAFATIRKRAVVFGGCDNTGVARRLVEAQLGRNVVTSAANVSHSEASHGGGAMRAYSAVWAVPSPATLRRQTAPGDEGEEAYYLNDAWLLNVEKEHWKRVECTGAPPSHRAYAHAVAINLDLVVHGGAIGRNYLLDVHVLSLAPPTSPGGNRWSQVRVDGLVPRSNGVAVSLGATVLVLGGRGAGARAVPQAQAFRVSGGNAVTLKELNAGPGARVDACAVVLETLPQRGPLGSVHADAIVVLRGGKNEAGHAHTDLWTLAINANEPDTDAAIALALQVDGAEANFVPSTERDPPVLPHGLLLDVEASAHPGEEPGVRLGKRSAPDPIEEPRPESLRKRAPEEGLPSSLGASLAKLVADAVAQALQPLQEALSRQMDHLEIRLADAPGAAIAALEARLVRRIEEADSAWERRVGELARGAHERELQLARERDAARDAANLAQHRLARLQQSLAPLWHDQAPTPRDEEIRPMSSGGFK